MRRALVLLVLLVGLSIAVRAQEFEHRQPPPDVLPRFVVNGFNSYKSVGPEAALKTWTEFSALDNSKESADQASYLREVQSRYGLFEGYDFISSRLLTPRTRVIYVVMNYERGPLFAKFVIYRSTQRWLLSGIDFNTREEMILPPGTSQ